MYIWRSLFRDFKCYWSFHVIPVVGISLVVLSLVFPNIIDRWYINDHLGYVWYLSGPLDQLPSIAIYMHNPLAGYTVCAWILGFASM